ncbi:MAG: hypothetical protein HZB82_04130 [Deltaproteobacteria bacterium]|nr:hypothetical protein [Deltaproteobacteria bacterium]
MKRKVMALMIGLCLTVPALAGAEVAPLAEVSDPLLQKLIEKGTLSEQEAGEIQSKKGAASRAAELHEAFKGLSIGGVVFLDYSTGKTANANGTSTDYNRFTLQRAYININKEITPWMKFRITPDITTSSTATGNYVMRMKYAYANFLASDAGLLTNTEVRVGLAQTPWLDFEEAMQGYRMQSALFQDKRGLVTSSDLGVGVLGNLGGKLDKEKTAGVGSGSYAGRFGSYHIGLYNGGGYSSTTGETNTNKALQGRLTIRPLADMFPGLQLTYFGITGKGNAVTNSTGKPQGWMNNTALASYQHKYATATAEFFTGRGSSGGDAIYAKRKQGYSYFAKFILPMYEKAAIFGRYENLDPNKDVKTDNIKTAIAGLSYRIAGANYVVAAYERTHDKTLPKEDKKAQVVLQVSF